jgi:hypothetical protein
MQNFVSFCLIIAPVGHYEHIQSPPTPSRENTPSQNLGLAGVRYPSKILLAETLQVVLNV